jgi:hypothetical protein
VRWSAATDPTNWTATDFNKLWEKDQQAIVALHIGSGQDIQGQAGPARVQAGIDLPDQTTPRPARTRRRRDCRRRRRARRRRRRVEGDHDLEARHLLVA